jgi:hypothetical protein
MISYVKNAPVVSAISLLVGFFLASSVPAVYDFGTSVYDGLRPVASDWKVNSKFTDGNDLVVSGTMVKNRSCMFVPPTLARDAFGKNHLVISTSPTSGKTWAADESPQAWGPWRVVDGASDTLTFINIYLCNGNRPSVVELGTVHR